MTPKQMKKYRKKMSMTQDSMASTIGMSRLMIGLMERGVKPIETRTEMSIKWILSEYRKNNA